MKKRKISCNKVQKYLRDIASSTTACGQKEYVRDETKEIAISEHLKDCPFCGQVWDEVITQTRKWVVEGIDPEPDIPYRPRFSFRLPSYLEALCSCLTRMGRGELDEHIKLAALRMLQAFLKTEQYRKLPAKIVIEAVSQALTDEEREICEIAIATAKLMHERLTIIVGARGDRMSRQQQWPEKTTFLAAPKHSARGTCATIQLELTREEFQQKRPLPVLFLRDSEELPFIYGKIDGIRDEGEKAEIKVSFESPYCREKKLRVLWPGDFQLRLFAAKWKRKRK